MPTVMDHLAMSLAYRKKVKINILAIVVVDSSIFSPAENITLPAGAGKPEWSGGFCVPLAGLVKNLYTTTLSEGTLSHISPVDLGLTQNICHHTH